jgi:hypothetical protein
MYGAMEQGVLQRTAPRDNKAFVVKEDITILHVGKDRR